MSSPEKRGALRRFAAAVVRPPAVVLTRRVWLGQEHIPQRSGVVVACNHVSMADPVVIAHYLYDAGRFPRFLGKASLFEAPAFGRLLLGAGQIPVFRDTGRASEALQAAVDAVAAGGCVVVYPESTVTRDRDLWPMTGKSGAVRIALTAGAPLVPLASWGAQDILPYRGKPRPLPPKKVKVKAGAAIDLDAYRGRVDDPVAMAAATDTVMHTIAGLLAELRGEQSPAVLHDRRKEGA